MISALHDKQLAGVLCQFGMVLAVSGNQMAVLLCQFGMILESLARRWRFSWFCEQAAVSWLYMKACCSWYTWTIQRSELRLGSYNTEKPIFACIDWHIISFFRFGLLENFHLIINFIFYSKIIPKSNQDTGKVKPWERFGFFILLFFLDLPNARYCLKKAALFFLLDVFLETKNNAKCE